MKMSRSHVDKIGDQIRRQGLTTESLVQLSLYRDQFGPSYQIVEDILSNKLGLSVSGRPVKSTTAIVEKLHRESIRLSQIQDIAGCRVILPGMYSQDRLVGHLEIMLEKAKVIDRRSAASHGYRAVHVITITKGLPVEVQVRTRVQHTWADLSEKLADIYGQEIKYGKGRADVVEMLSDLSVEGERLEKIRYDKTLVRGGQEMRFHNQTSQRSMSKLLKELDRLDRQSVIRLKAILSRELAE